MASAVATLRHTPRAAAGYRRVLVPISAAEESVRAVELACSLAAEYGAEVTAVFVVVGSPKSVAELRAAHETSIHGKPSCTEPLYS